MEWIGYKNVGTLKHNLRRKKLVLWSWRTLARVTKAKKQKSVRLSINLIIAKAIVTVLHAYITNIKSR